MELAYLVKIQVMDAYLVQPTTQNFKLNVFVKITLWRSWMKTLDHVVINNTFNLDKIFTSITWMCIIMLNLFNIRDDMYEM